eukprot:53843_1
MCSKLTIIISLLGIVPLVSGGMQAPDNFFFSFKKDLNSFGVKSRSKKNMVRQKNKKVFMPESMKRNDFADKSIIMEDKIDDFDRAEENLFHAVEKIEKVAICIAHDMVHDEVDILFGKDHGHSLHTDCNEDNDDILRHVPHRRRSSSNNKKDNCQMTTKTEEKEGHKPSFDHFMESYAQNCLASQYGW